MTFSRGLILSPNAVGLLDRDLNRFCESIPISTPFGELYANQRAVHPSGHDRIAPEKQTMRVDPPYDGRTG